MAMRKKISAGIIAVLVLAGPASAFTPTDSVLETDQSNLSTLWQPAVAQPGDTIAAACEGFKYAACVREFVMGNRDKFPEQFQSETDFWLYADTTYMVPLLSGAMASARQTSPTPETQPSMVTIMNGLTANQERMADELARLSRDFGALAVADINGLGEMLAQVNQQAQGFAEVQSVVQRLEAAYVQLQNGELTTGMLNAIQAENTAALESITTDIAALQQADITFSNRLDAVEAEVATLTEQLPTTVQTEVDNQLSEQLPSIMDEAQNTATRAAQNVVGEIEQAQSWNNLLAYAALVIALFAVGFVLWVRRSTKDLAVTVHSNEERLYGEDGLAEKHEELSAYVHDEHDGLAATRDIATTALSQNSTLTFQDTPDIKFVTQGATSHWKMSVGDKDSDDYQTFEVSFTKRPDGLFDWSVPRNKDGTGESQPVSYKSVEGMKTKLQQAYINGRLQYCVTRSSKSDKDVA